MIHGTGYDVGGGEVLFYPDLRCYQCNGSRLAGKKVSEPPDEDDPEGWSWRDETQQVTCDACYGYGWWETTPSRPPVSKIPGHQPEAFRGYMDESLGFRTFDDPNNDPLGAPARERVGEPPIRFHA